MKKLVYSTERNTKKLIEQQMTTALHISISLSEKVPLKENTYY
jgi:hypothetical protein